VMRVTHDWVVPSEARSHRAMAEEARTWRRLTSSWLAKGGTHCSTSCAPHWRKGVPPGKAVAGPGRRPPSRAGPQRRPGPNAALLLPPNGWGDNTLSLDERHTQLKNEQRSLPIPKDDTKALNERDSRSVVI